MIFIAIKIYIYAPYDNYASHPQDRSDPILLYSSDEKTEYNVIPGTLRKEINKPESFEFDIYPTIYNEVGRVEYADVLPLEVGSDYISIEDTNYSNDDNNGILFYGRIIGIDYSIQGKRHVICEGLLANLTDFPMYMPSSENPNGKSVDEFDRADGMHNVHTRDTGYIFEYAMRAYNEGTERTDIHEGTVSSNNVYTKETADDDGDNWFSFTYPWSQSVGDFIMSQLINVYGGMLKMRYIKQTAYKRILGELDWTDEPVNDKVKKKNRPQTIKYGDNALDATYEDISSDMVSGIFGTGINKYKGKHWNYDRYNGHYRPYVIYGTNWNNTLGGANIVKAVEFENARTESQLKSQVRRYVKLYCSNRKFKVTVKCIDKHFININNSNDTNYDMIDIGYSYKVEIPFLGAAINEDLTCLSCEIDIGDMKNSSYTFGDYIPPELMKSRYITG